MNASPRLYYSHQKNPLSRHLGWERGIGCVPLGSGVGQEGSLGPPPQRPLHIGTLHNTHLSYTITSRV